MQKAPGTPGEMNDNEIGSPTANNGVKIPTSIDWDSPSAILKESLALGGGVDERGTVRGISSSSVGGNGWGEQIFAGIDSPGGGGGGGGGGGLAANGSTEDMVALTSASSSGRLTGGRSATSGIAALSASGLGSGSSSTRFFIDSPSILKKRGGGSVNSMSLGMPSPGYFGVDDPEMDLGLNLRSFSTTAAGASAFASAVPFGSSSPFVHDSLSSSSIAHKKRNSAAKFNQNMLFGQDELNQETTGFHLQMPASVMERLVGSNGNAGISNFPSSSSSSSSSGRLYPTTSSGDATSSSGRKRKATEKAADYHANTSPANQSLTKKGQLTKRTTPMSMAKSPDRGDESMHSLLQAVSGSGHTFSSSDDNGGTNALGSSKSPSSSKKNRSKNKSKDLEKDETQRKQQKQQKKENKEREKLEQKLTKKKAKLNADPTATSGGVGSSTGLGIGCSPAAAVARHTNATVAFSSKPIVCNCKKSKCLKLYCDCFRFSKFCDGCNCLDCANSGGREEERLAAIGVIIERNPDAFKAIVIDDTIIEDINTTVDMNHATTTAAAGAAHKNGCHCKKSACLKKYCECFTALVPCSDKCKCAECKNTSDLYANVDISSATKNASIISTTLASRNPSLSMASGPSSKPFFPDELMTSIKNSTADGSATKRGSTSAKRINKPVLTSHSSGSGSGNNNSSSSGGGGGGGGENGGGGGGDGSMEIEDNDKDPHRDDNDDVHAFSSGAPSSSSRGRNHSHTITNTNDDHHRSPTVLRSSTHEGKEKAGSTYKNASNKEASIPI